MGGVLSRSGRPRRDEGRRRSSPLHHKRSRDFHLSPKFSSAKSPSSIVPQSDSERVQRSLSPQSEVSASHSYSSVAFDESIGSLKRFPDRPEGYSASSAGPSASEDSSVTDSHQSETNFGLSSAWMIDYKRVQLGKVLGHSSFGVVQEAFLDGTRVAVKTIRLNPKTNADDEVQAFKKEAELNCKLRHPNIVLFMGICVEPKHVCIVTELMARGNVLELLIGPVNGKPVKLSWKTRLQWALDTAMGMCYLHSLSPSMIHRDLKTTNLLVDRGMNVKICDFGMSRFKAEDKIMSAVGTVQFAAPEVLKNERYSEKADLFSFGTVLWELYTRARVFKGLPQLEVYRAVIEGSMPAVPPSCPSSYRRLMITCWSLDPNMRPTFREAIQVLLSIEASVSSS